MTIQRGSTGIGAGVLNASVLTLSNSTLTANNAGFDGGAVFTAAR